MAKRPSIKHLRSEAPEWVFRWRPLSERYIPKWLALFAVGGLFAFLLSSVRIRVASPTPWAARKATLIHIGDDAESRILSLRAREGGPFPTRFEPSEWAAVAAMEAAAFEAIRQVPPAYEPKLRELADQAPPPIRLAARGEPVLPKRRIENSTVLDTANLRLAPVLHPLSGITAAAMPATLPVYPLVVDEKMAAKPWRFLIRLNALGMVTDCISLDGGGEEDASDGAGPLADWLRRVSFNPEPTKPSRWISVGVAFTNQITDGSDAR